ncbi:MAG: flagellar motor protein MotB [Agathobacter sp.]|nr:flagellar motor protein MotB [Agathobacter sp.]
MVKRQEEPKKGSPAWMSTFSDLMNLLLCFFVLLYSMSSVDEEKFQQVIASLQSTVSILSNGGATIGDGEMISAGVRQLEFLDSYYKEMTNSMAPDTDTEDDGKGNFIEEYEQEALNESQEMADEIEVALNVSGISDMVDVTFNSQYVQLDLSGAILFESGKADLVTEAYPIMDKIGKILERYNKHIIEVEGHTDNVPISSSRFPNNNVLSMFRAMSVADYLREHTNLPDANLKSSGRGAYVPIADNTTAEGRARNRRVEIKVYNSYSSRTN